MDNKLSELSKPVGYFIEWQDEETGEKEWCECSKQNGEPLYSQEYVSALLAELEDERASREQWQQNCTRTEERIAELESEMKVWESAATKHLARAEEAEQRIAELSELEAHNECLIKKNADLTQLNIKLGERLATPVRLLGEMLLHDWEHSVERQATFQHRKIAWDARLAVDKKAILAAGFTFTVEGDE
ncbi:hypothetical protein I5P68_10475 [Serratia ureilytica]|uniref:hypothetical protein n=1 Tax=Serratia ureilytica TaxID=300181 RepID=UPI0018DA23F7|nr:hypothetical protein [Serratia ureilytica]MBH2720186.1 hypothetical protein [Serratia ureilytica]